MKKKSKMLKVLITVLAIVVLVGIIVYLFPIVKKPTTPTR